MPRAKGKTMRTRAKARARRHGLTARAFKRKGLRRRWLVHQLAGANGYKDTDLPYTDGPERNGYRLEHANHLSLTCPPTIGVWRRWQRARFARVRL
jgi:hypothetical protein